MKTNATEGVCEERERERSKKKREAVEGRHDRTWERKWRMKRII